MMRSRKHSRKPAGHAGRPRYACEPLEDRTLLATFTVLNTNDSGAGSLRSAIQSANSTSGLDFIDFNIPGAGVHTIRPTTGLPRITDSVFINGETQPGYTLKQPLIELDGSLAGDAYGLDFGVGGNWVQGLVVNRFGYDGIAFAELDSTNPTGLNTVLGNFIGTDPTGTVAKPNGLAGLMLLRSPHNTIKQNLISGNNDSGIFIAGGYSTDNHIEGNSIGTDVTGLKPLGNRLNGISVSAGNVPALRQGTQPPPGGYASGNVIGGADLELGNVIAGNGQAGVHIFRGEDNKVLGNYIGVGADGVTPVPNGTAVGGAFGQDGVWIEEGSRNEIGGAAEGAGNVISGNRGAGIRISAIKITAEQNLVAGNLIGTNKDGTFGEGLGNAQGGVRIRNESADDAVLVRVDQNAVGGVDADDGEEDGTVLARNVIAGNTGNGVEIVGHRTTDNRVQGNFIGVDKTGLTRLANTEDGIHLSIFVGQSPVSVRTLVGGDQPGAGNVVSGNGNDGVFIGFGARAAVAGNVIGTNKDGTAAVGNGRNGVLILDSSDNFIGAKVTPEPGLEVAIPNLISGNALDGVQITGDADRNKLVANLIGVDATGAGALGNGRHGVAIFDATGNEVGDATALGRNVIVNNAAAGVAIVGPDASQNAVRGNYVGLTADGAAAPGNRLHGVIVYGGARQNTIGGTEPGQRNVISGNDGVGVSIEGGDDAINEVIGNYIGTDADGALKAGFGNFLGGVYVRNSGSNTVAGNTLRGNGAGAGDGVNVSGPQATDNVVARNVITHSGLRGVHVLDGASATSIGVVGESDSGNLISANDEGVLIEGGAHDTSVVFNRIGTDPSGAFADGFGNTSGGVSVVDAHDNHLRENTIRGSTVGLTLGPGADSNEVFKNVITNNDAEGVLLFGASKNEIGVNDPEFRNLISANGVGVRIEGASHDNDVSGNYIGTDETGALKDGFGNAGAGVVIEDSYDNVLYGNTLRGNGSLAGDGVEIRGADAKRNRVQGNVITHSGLRGVRIFDQASENSVGLGNLISANGDGVVIDGGAHDNDVSDNLIGTNENGAFADGFGNTDNGILVLESRGNTIDGNKIRGNGTGVTLGPGADQNTVTFNKITNNGEAGVLITLGATDNVVGGGDGESGNVVSRNGEGVRIDAGAEANVIQGNFIGTDEDYAPNDAFGNAGPGVVIVDAPRNVLATNVITGNGDGVVIQGAGSIKNAIRDSVIARNKGYGVLILEGASGNPIGGVDTDFFNRISDNGKDGVAIRSGTENAVLRNKIFGNRGLGIDLGDDGVTFNDRNRDSDSGANTLQNFPELAYVTVGGSRRIVGTLKSAPSALYILEFFAAAAPDGSGFGQAERFVATTAVTTNASGVALFDIPLPEDVAEGTFLTATATDAKANTSEFAKTVRVERDTDGDGIPDRLEANGPNAGDGNQDGIRDGEQPTVVSFPNAENGSYVTLELGSRSFGLPAPAGARFSGVRALGNPSPDDAPAGVGFGLGLFDFAITGMPPGGGVVVEVFLPFDAVPSSYYRYGPTPDQPAPHWYDWAFDGFTGAQIYGNRALLTFGDGARGDDDLVANGTIVDPGGPGFRPSIVVTNTLDSGPGSLRQAILDANARPGLDFIAFDIGNGGVRTITPLTNLPAITDPAVIDGTTQDGFAGKPLIELSGQLVPFGTGLQIAAPNTTVRGLVVNRFANAGVDVSSLFSFQNGPVIEGSYIGTDVTGTLARGNGLGVRVGGGSNTRLGGTDPGSRNVISGNLGDGVSLPTGTGHLILGNAIGVAADGVSPLGNGGSGVWVGDTFGVKIGGLADGAGNVIAFNARNGIWDLAATQNRQTAILSNAIHSNALMGISRSPDNVVALNDDGTRDGLLQNMQNFPVLGAARRTGGQTTISGYLNSTPASTFLIQFFGNTGFEPNGYGEGQTLLGSLLVDTDAGGRADFSATFAVDLPGQPFVTATATNYKFGTFQSDTSEFSARLAVGDVLTQVIIVNSADDVDDGVADAAHTSLREAIHAANNHPGPDVIRFAIGGGGVKIINPLTPLPVITDAVLIDGTSQPGFTGTPIIVLNGGLMSPAGAGLQIVASNTTVRGLVVNSFARGIDIFEVPASPGFSGVVIEGNYIGTDVTGTAARPNGVGVFVRGGANHVVGGMTPAARNVISGNTGDGVTLSAGAGYRVLGNYIGVAADGVSPLGNGENGVGIPLQTSSGNVTTRLTGATIGGLQPGAGNVIAYNAIDGVLDRQPANGNAILSNSIHSNALLGISYYLGNYVVLNERPSGFESGGKPQTYPVLFSAQSGGGDQTTISGYLDSTPDSTFVIQFFANASVEVSGFGEGETYLGSATVTTDAGGHADFTATLPVGVANRRLITATATNVATNNTSQFSRRLAVGDVLTGVYVVNTTDDVDDGVADAAHTSLREAIHAASNHPGPDVIRFAIGTGPRTIAPLTPLPTIVDAVLIDGTTQPGFTASPIIELTGTQMTRQRFNHPAANEFFLSGLVIRGNGTTIRGLAINRFYELQVRNGSVILAGGDPLLVLGDNNVIEGNYFGLGTNGAGLTASGAPFNINNLNGVIIQGAGNRVGGTTPQQRNVISGHNDVGLSITGSGHVIQGNYIGTNAGGTAAVGNGRGTAFSGVGVQLSATGVLLGGSAPGAGNVISGNNGDGLRIRNPGNTVQGNYIGTNAGGAARLPNAGDGIVIDDNTFHEPGTGGNLIGGALPGQRNVISGNRVGVFISFGTGQVIQGNYIGTDVTGTLDLGNTLDGVVLRGQDNLVGGTAAGAGNLISGNDRFGVFVSVANATTGNRVEGNRIGTRADGTSALGNGSDGVAVAASFNATTDGTGPVNNTVGGLTAGAGNVIAFNGRHGVNVLAGQRIGILSNSIFSNAQRGIDLNGDGPTPNDGGDADTGDNDLQNFPLITSATTDGTRTSISGTFNSRPNTKFTLQFFANAAADPSGFGEGQALVRSIAVTTDSAGNAAFTLIVAAGVAAAGQFVTATATDPSNNTSEFSPAVQVTGGAVPTNFPPTAAAGGPYTIDEGAPLQLDGSDSADPDDDALTYTWDVNGDGVFGDAAGVAPTLSWTQLQALGITDGPAAYNVRVRANDGRGGEATSGPATLAILNVAPTATPGLDVTVHEGDPVSLVGAFTDPGPADTHTFRWQVFPSNGQVVEDSLEQTLRFVPNDDGYYYVVFTVRDDDGGESSTSFYVIAENLSPTLRDVSAATAAGGDGLVTLRGGIADPGTPDTFTLTVDWGDGSDPETFSYAAGTALFQEPHRYADPTRTYAVTVALADDDGGTTSAETTVQFNRPPTANAGGAYAVNEGDGLALDASASSDPDGDSVTYTWDVNGDGVFGDATGAAPTLSRQQLQALGIVDGPAAFAVRVRVSDGQGHETTSQPATLTLRNVAPSVDAGPSQTVREGDGVTLSGSFTDPGSADTHTFQWQVLASNGQAVASGDQPTFHFVPADNGTYTITFTVTDDDGGSASDTVVVTAANVAPTLAGVTAAAIGRNVTLQGTLSDPGPADTFTLVVDWGDGSPEQAFTYPPGTTLFRETHLFPDPPAGAHTYAIRLRLLDDDGGESRVAQDVTIVGTSGNAAPVLNPLHLSAATINEGGSITVTGSYTDADSSDTHAVTIDWGDGIVTAATVDPATRTFTATRAYRDDAPTGTPADTYLITATVADNHGASSAPATAPLTVNNLAPAFTNLPAHDAYCGVAAGQRLSLSATFTDPGALDAHTALIDWGDGTTTPGTTTETAGAGTVSASHAYASAGVYTVTLTVRDDDGGQATSTFQALVTGAAVRDGVLVIVGTPGADHVTLNRAKGKSGDVYRVHADFFDDAPFRDFPAAGVTHVLIFGCAGDDHLTVASNIAIPVVLDGGAGDDKLNGGGRSLLVGGPGRDKLVGGPGDDILVGGALAFDLNPAALKGVFSGASTITAATVLDDRDADQLVGGAGRNTLFEPAPAQTGTSR